MGLWYRLAADKTHHYIAKHLTQDENQTHIQDDPEEENCKIWLWRFSVNVQAGREGLLFEFRGGKVVTFFFSQNLKKKKLMLS